MRSLKKIAAKFFSGLLFILYLLVKPIFRIIYDREKNRKPLAPITDGILTKSAVEIARLIRSREITSRQAVEAFINRIEQVNKEINAVVYKRYEEALNEADEIDRTLDENPNSAAISDDERPFLGVPITVKEAIMVKGCPNTSGLLLRRDVISDTNADTVALLLESGVIVVATTNISEVCMWYESSNLLYGRTRNAYHRGRIVGGSSGGEGCIQSVGGSAFGLGSDVGGSIRMPAFFNGVFGHKATLGMVSNKGQYPMEKGTTRNLLTTGPLCRYATDLVPILKIITIPEERHMLKLDEQVDVKKLNVFYMDDGDCLFSSPVHPEIKECMKKALDHFREIGCPVKKMNLWQFKYSLFVWICKMSDNPDKVSFNRLMGNMTHEVNPYWELFLWLLHWPRHTLPAISLGIMDSFPYTEQQYKWADQINTGLRDALEVLMEDDGVFLYPTHPIPAPYHNLPLLAPFNFMYTGIFNALGLPVTAVPMGLSRSEGVPLGFQVVASRFQDRLTCAVARELERVFGGWVPPSEVLL